MTGQCSVIPVCDNARSSLW